ncbi:hypothetical protein [Rhodobacter sp. NSM]|uniref:hypothetical protein n=1 Tax=Rhodobacter sp. NSM TaxID=3457501 RepID=UPI003FD5755C
MEAVRISGLPVIAGFGARSCIACREMQVTLSDLMQGHGRHRAAGNVLRRFVAHVVWCRADADGFIHRLTHALEHDFGVGHLTEGGAAALEPVTKPSLDALSYTSINPELWNRKSPFATSPPSAMPAALPLSAC